MLLSREENGAGGKGSVLPAEWFASKSATYLSMHLIPDDPALWGLDAFEAFLAARKAMIKIKLADLISQV